MSKKGVVAVAPGRTSSKRQPPKRRAPEFARRLQQALTDAGKTQRQAAKESETSCSVVNRLCTDGVGTDGHVCRVLKTLNWKRRRILEIVADRKAELAADDAEREVWKNFRYAYTDEEECLSDLCPWPIHRGYACTHAGVALGEVIRLAKEYELPPIADIDKLDPWKLVRFFMAFEQKFGQEKREIVLAKECGEHPPVLMYDLREDPDAAKGLTLKGCSGRLLFGLPHLAVASYQFSLGGQLEVTNMRGVELAYSVEGTFEITYEDETYPLRLTPPRGLLIMDARGRHEIRLVEGERGSLVTALYYPVKRDVSAKDIFPMVK